MRQTTTFLKIALESNNLEEIKAVVGNILSNMDNENIEDEALATMAEITSQLAVKVKADITELFRLVHDISGILVTQQKQIDKIKNK